MIVNQFTDEELRQMIVQLMKHNNVEAIHNKTPNEIAESFLAYTTIGRQIILDWYSGLAKTKNKMNWIEKNGFERKYFYISGTDAAAAMMLLGYKVRSDRYANITQISMDRLNQYGHSCQKNQFFEKYNLCSNDINHSWVNC